MSVRKQIEDSFIPIYRGLDKIAIENHDSLLRFGDKLDCISKRTFYKRVCAFRNWLTHFLLWILLGLLLSSCFVSGRNFHVVTPRVELLADTATAFSWPYGTKFQ